MEHKIIHKEKGWVVYECLDPNDFFTYKTYDCWVCKDENNGDYYAINGQLMNAGKNWEYRLCEKCLNKKFKIVNNKLVQISIFDL